ncbi:unnamed protein product [Lactuca saligna]|uniref:Single-stranded DNA binding protein Ssb-like OB fold domain-containing protein n=1 Tax=Lactuca saligna TaxID=75948 RepID=A0AA35YQL5_LACSI|nr:unnamed protein product [Lactuca saligna]
MFVYPNYKRRLALARSLISIPNRSSPPFSLKFYENQYSQLRVCGKMAEQTKQQPAFTKIDQLRPGAFGLNLTVKVVSSKMIMTRGGRNGTQGRNNMRLAECLVGDETGIIVFTARNDQVDAMKEGSSVILRNAKIDMYKGSMRLAVDKWGRVEITDAAAFSVKEDSNLSLIEFELITVEE